MKPTKSHTKKADRAEVKSETMSQKYKHSRFIVLYQKTALIFLNTLLAFLLLNIIVFVVAKFNTDIPPPPLPSVSTLSVNSYGTLGWGLNRLKQVYPGVSEINIIKLIIESSNVQLQCDDNTAFREGAFNGTFFKVHQEGFRLNGTEQIWPYRSDSINIFVFGGSTTFGYNERAEKTIPASLERQLRKLTGKTNINVYNFGHCYYNIVQEQMEFDRLIDQGFIPDFSIFIDGLNGSLAEDPWGTGIYDVPANNCNPTTKINNTLKEFLSCNKDEFCWPIQRFTMHLLQSTHDQTEKKEIKETLNVLKNKLPEEKRKQGIIDQWLLHKKAIEQLAEKNGIKTLFVLQPIPFYAYDMNRHVFKDIVETQFDSLRQQRTQGVYETWIERAQADNGGKGTSNFLDLSRLGENKKTPIYVDRVHYAGEFMNDIASQIVAYLTNHQKVIPLENF